MTAQRTRFALLCLVAAAALLGCRPAAIDDSPAQLVLGSWSASESIELFGRTLTSSVALTFTASQFTLDMDTQEGGVLEHRLDASGTYAVSGNPRTITLNLVSARQAADVLTAGADPANLADLSPADLADLATDFPAALSYTISGSSMTLTFPDAPALVFTKAGP
jgi:hypothetical protein